MDVEKLFNALESNNTAEYEEAKKTLAEFFIQNKEQWLMQGMMEYYLRTNSVRIIEFIVKVQTPHDVYVFDRLSEWLRGPNRVPALTLFGFIIRKHPTWLYKVAKHKLIKDILKLLQTEKEIVPLMSALLCIITLLPIIPSFPSLVPNFLPDLFDVFSHLASWNCQNPNKLSENQLIHLQIGLCMLFNRLYGMYPCHFVTYLRDFIVKEKGAIFQHTIKPLLETVRMHPMLVTATKETEINSVRWKEMEPHDVVVECAKLTLEYCQESSDCVATLRTQESFTADTPVAAQLKASMSSPFYCITQGPKSTDLHKIDSIWSPSIEILSTPPPTGTVPHTPTPSYGVPVVANPSSILGVTGASPPEAAVEATPETTPMKDIILRKASAANSSAVRPVLTSSQPSSPMRKDHAFNFPEAKNKIYMQMVYDRNQAQLYSIGRSNSAEGSRHGQNAQTAPLNLQDLQLSNTANFLKSEPIQCLDSPTCPTVSTQEDQEVTELTSQQMGPHHSDTLQDISNESEECDEAERSPCSAGGLHVPTNRSMRILAESSGIEWLGGIKRNRMASYCHNDTSSYLSYGTSPADAGIESYASAAQSAKIERAKSWPTIDRRPSLEESTEMENTISHQNQYLVQANGDSSSPSGDDAMSAATHFKRLQQKRERNAVPVQRFDLKNRTYKTTCSTQTVQQWPQIYEYNLLEIFTEDNKIRNISSTNVLKPFEVLKQYIEGTIKMKNSTESKNRDEGLKDQIHLLYLQLQYERYRREIHAERNRRLLGKSRAIRSLEMDNERLNDQLVNLQNECQALTIQLNSSRKAFNEREQELSKEVNIWKSRYQTEMEDNKQLRANIENLQRRLNEEIKSKKEANYDIEALRGELFDMSNQMQQAQNHAELGLHYKQELSKLELEFMVMGENQIKCRDKLNELGVLAGKEEELQQLQKVYNDEIRELRTSLDDKSAQLESAKHRLSELQTQLANKEVMFTDQKRLSKSVKDEYEEKFKALSNKYEIQKAIILQMEEQISELSKSQLSAAASTPESSERIDLPTSMDYNSPLSASLASSEGLSTSLRSVSELRNLQALVVEPNTASGNTTATTSATMASTSTANAPYVSSNVTVTASSSARRGSSSQQFTYQQSATTKTAAKSSAIAVSSAASSAASSSRQTAPSLDIPLPGPSQHHSHLRHNYSTHH